ncbi:hypothetical protein ACFVRD_35840 [Streptomyces sp. NPDC057908]|uniref:hypothetical protein n=1 Tax=Streptomyces sp. NPDC057908 TaxID=3346276 RepID=UPI0036EC8CF8
MILIGVDPHNAAGHQVAQRRFVVNAGTFRQLMRRCEQWPERRFAVEGAGGLGRSLAQQLAAAGENVVDVPPTLSARARLLATGGDRKTDAKDELLVNYCCPTRFAWWGSRRTSSIQLSNRSADYSQMSTLISPCEKSSESADISTICA